MQLRIGQVSKLSGASPKALRLYESLGLIPVPARQGKYRVYGPLHVDAVLLIREAQALGFRLKELQQLAAQAPLLELVGLGLALQAVQSKRVALAQQQRALQRQQDALREFERRLQQAREAACQCTEWSGRA